MKRLQTVRKTTCKHFRDSSCFSSCCYRLFFTEILLKSKQIFGRSHTNLQNPCRAATAQNQQTLLLSPTPYPLLPRNKNPIKSISRKQERENMLFDVGERLVHQFRLSRSYLYRIVAGDNRDSTNWKCLKIKAAWLKFPLCYFRSRSGDANLAWNGINCSFFRRFKYRNENEKKNCLKIYFGHI